MSEESLETRLSVHEAICAERYEKIKESFEKGAKRMRNIEVLLYITIAAVLLGPGVAAVFVKKVIGL